MTCRTESSRSIPRATMVDRCGTASGTTALAENDLDSVVVLSETQWGAPGPPGTAVPIVEDPRYGWLVDDPRTSVVAQDFDEAIFRIDEPLDGAATRST